MRKSRFNESHIVAVLKESEAVLLASLDNMISGLLFPKRRIARGRSFY